jgi:hypothetical protein
MSVWQHKAEQRAAAAAVHAAVARAHEQKAAEAAALEKSYAAWCEATAEHGYKVMPRDETTATERVRAWWQEQYEARHPKVDLSKDFPALGK